MAVYYRYKSEVETFSVPMPEPTVSVGELKRLIMGTARYGNCRHGQRIELYKSLPGDAEEQYDDDAKPVSPYSTLIACRLPSHPVEPITMVPASCPLTPKSEQPHGSSSSSPTSSASPAAAAMLPAAPVLAPPPSIPEDLHCKICSNVMVDAVVASKCCFWIDCDGCVRDRIAEMSRCACGALAHSEELIPNPTVRKTIANQLAALDASQKKQRGTVSKHTDGSSSSPTSKTMMTMEYDHEPHRAVLHCHHDRKRNDPEDWRQKEHSFSSVIEMIPQFRKEN